MKNNKLEMGKVNAVGFVKSFQKSRNNEFDDLLRSGITFFLIATRMKYLSMKDIEQNISFEYSVGETMLIKDYFDLCCFRFLDNNDDLKKNKVALLKWIWNNQSIKNGIEGAIQEIYNRLIKVWKTDKIYDVISEHISDYAKKKLGGVTTPMILVKEIIDKMTIVKYSVDDRFLDPSCGFGPFLYYFKKILINQGMTECEAITCLYGVDIDPVKAGVFSTFLPPCLL